MRPAATVLERRAAARALAMGMLAHIGQARIGFEHRGFAQETAIARFGEELLGIAAEAAFSSSDAPS